MKFKNLYEKVQKCKNSVFCYTWGEYKCLVIDRRLDIETDCVECKLFSKINPSDEKKGICQCETCYKRGTCDDINDEVIEE